MSPGLDKKLCEAFPLLYRDRGAPMDRTCMCWGFPGDGWFQIIWDLSAKLEPLIAAMPASERPCASQVKEKFGTLRFYMNSETDEMSALITETEKLSAATCEECGAPGKLRGKSWLFTACARHAVRG